MKRLIALPLFACSVLACVAGAQPLPDAIADVPTSVGHDVVGPGAVSTEEAAEIKLAVTPDGRQQLWGAVGRTAPGKHDIWERHMLPDGSWSDPAPISINGPGEDFDPALSADGRLLYFHSNRPGGYGRTDIYVAERQGEFGWSEPRNLGPLINSEGAEWAPADGRVLFASNGWGGEGGHDIFVGDPQVEEAPANLGSGVNSDLSEFDATVSSDGQTLLFSRGRYGASGEDFHVYRSQLENGVWSEARKVAVGCGNYTIGLAFLPDGSFSYSSRCPKPDEVRMLIMRMSRESLDSAS